MNHFGQAFFGVADRIAFAQSLNTAIAAIAGNWKTGIFTGDNLFTFGKNLSFLQDAPFMAAMAAHAGTDVEKSIVWRTAVLAWAARNGLRRPGDFVECGCYRGISARIVCDTVGFGTLDRRFVLYDLFDYPQGSTHTRMPGMGPELLDEVRRRFADLPNVAVHKGAVPDVLEGTAPERIALLHLDMNQAAPEIGALERLFDRIVPGGFVVLDDYGYMPYRAQRDAERAWFAARGYDVLELPTGQGLVLK